MNLKETNLRIGFIGQGFIGKNYADDFERRGYTTIRYALEEPYTKNKAKIATCDIVFIAVPTPTLPIERFPGGKLPSVKVDDSIVREAIALVGKGKIAVVKSTILPGTTNSFQDQYPDRTVLYSPEFLSEATAAQDAAHPFSNIVGSPIEDSVHQEAARILHSILPSAPFTLTCTSTEAEIIKYSHNGSGYIEIIFFNLMYDLAQKLGANWESVQKALQADPYIANRYAKPLHKSGRGAGGHCFIKDFAALRMLYAHKINDTTGTKVFEAVEGKNIELLKESEKDLNLLAGVYGPDA